MLCCYYLMDICCAFFSNTRECRSFCEGPVFAYIHNWFVQLGHISLQSLEKNAVTFWTAVYALQPFCWGGGGGGRLSYVYLFCFFFLHIRRVRLLCVSVRRRDGRERQRCTPVSIYPSPPCFHFTPLPLFSFHPSPLVSILPLSPLFSFYLTPC